MAFVGGLVFGRRRRYGVGRMERSSRRIWRACGESVEDTGDSIAEELKKAMKEQSKNGRNEELTAGEWGNTTRAIALVFREGDREGIYSVGVMERKQSDLSSPIRM